MGYPFKHIYTSIRKEEPQDLGDVSPSPSATRWIDSHILVSIPVVIATAIVQLVVTVALILYVFYLRGEISLSPVNSQFRDPLGNYCTHFRSSQITVLSLLYLSSCSSSNRV
jgi:hypothetical protein